MISACAAPAAQSDADVFFTTLQGTLCGRTVTGRVVSDQAVDAEWRGETLSLGPVACEVSAITADMPPRAGDAVMVMPLAVGEDASRVWTLRPHPDGVEFRHFHYEPDGSPSAVTSYGGVNLPGGTAAEQRFPADAATQAVFTENGIARSNPNIWTLRLDEEAGTLTYALARPATESDPARDFRAVFDLDVSD